MNHELAKTLTTALVQFIDRERPEGTMCCSNVDCENIRWAFEEGEYDCIEAFIQKKLSKLTEFEQELVNFYNKRSMLPQDKDGTYNRHDCEELLHESAKKLLALAKKELARRDEVITLDNLSPYDKGFQDGKTEAMTDLERTFKCNPDKLPIWLKNELDRIRLEAHAEGYSEGLQRALNGNEKYESYHFAPITVRPLCWEPGGTCTNPQMDCINCPKRTTGGGFNTQFETSTAKVEG